MRLTAHIIICFAAFFTISLTPRPALAISPTDFIRNVVDETFATLRKYPVDGPSDNLTVRRENIKKIVDDHFDSREIAQRALGKYWKHQSAKDQDEFTRLFYWRLYNFYILRVENYSDEKIIYQKETIIDDKAAVYTRVSSARYPEFDIDYKLKMVGDSWKIYDVVIEGVSLVANYRSQFNSYLSKKTFATLLEALREKSPDINLQ